MEGHARQRIFSPGFSQWPNTAAALLFLLLYIGCSPALGGKAGMFAGPSDLVATMPDPYNVHLQWKNHATAEGGNLVEFQLHPEGASLPAEEREDFVILGFLNANETTFRHENLGSETVFTYRIRPYFGKSSEPAKITTGSAEAAKTEPDEPEGPLEKPGANSKSQSDDLKSVRQPATFGAATPANLSAALSSPTHVVLRWNERASNADGYLVEISLYHDKDFHVCALLPPHTTSFRKTGLPPETTIYFRVRAFFYGLPSNYVIKTSGPDRVEDSQPKIAPP